jgi:hypothetical protein
VVAADDIKMESFKNADDRRVESSEDFVLDGVSIPATLIFHAKPSMHEKMESTPDDDDVQYLPHPAKHPRRSSVGDGTEAVLKRQIFECEKCATKFISELKMTLHQRRCKGPRKGKFICPKCRNRYTRSANLHRHMRRKCVLNRKANNGEGSKATKTSTTDTDTETDHLKTWGFKSYKLSENTSVRYGLHNKQVMLRISNVNDLMEERPHSPPAKGLFTDNPRKKYNFNQYRIHELARTIFLTCDEVEELEDLSNNFITLPLPQGSCCCVGRQSKLCPPRLKKQIQNSGEYSTLGAYADLIGSGGTIKIITAKKIEKGYTNLGGVELSEYEFIELKKIIKEIYTQCRELEKCYGSISQITYKLAGDTLSRMTYGKFGKFCKLDVLNRNSGLLKAFMEVYGEFMCMGCVELVADQVHSVLPKENSSKLDITKLVGEILSQPIHLFTHLRIPNADPESVADENIQSCNCMGN